MQRDGGGMEWRREKNEGCSCRGGGVGEGREGSWCKNGKVADFGGSSCGVVAITPDFESGDRGFNPRQELWKGRLGGARRSWREWLYRNGCIGVCWCVTKWGSGRSVWLEVEEGGGGKRLYRCVLVCNDVGEWEKCLVGSGSGSGSGRSRGTWS